MTSLNELSIQNNEDAEKGSVDLKKSQRNSEKIFWHLSHISLGTMQNAKRISVYRNVNLTNSTSIRVCPINIR